MGSCASKNNDENLDHFSYDAKPITIETETWKRDSHGLFDYETNDVVKNSLRIEGSTQLFRENDHIEQSTNKYRNSRRADVILDVSLESRSNTITDKEDMEEEKNPNVDLEFQKKRLNASAESRKSFSKNEIKIPIAEVLYKHGQYWIYNKMYYDKDEDFTENPEKQIWYSIRDFRGSASSFGYSLKQNDILKFGRARLKVVKIKIHEEISKAAECRMVISQKLEKPGSSIDVPTN